MPEFLDQTKPPGHPEVAPGQDPAVVIKMCEFLRNLPDELAIRMVEISEIGAQVAENQEKTERELPSESQVESPETINEPVIEVNNQTIRSELDHSTTNLPRHLVTEEVPTEIIQSTALEKIEMTDETTQDVPESKIAPAVTSAYELPQDKKPAAVDPISIRVEPVPERLDPVISNFQTEQIAPLLQEFMATNSFESVLPDAISSEEFSPEPVFDQQKQNESTLPQIEIFSPRNETEVQSPAEMLAELEEPNLVLLQEVLPFVQFESHETSEAEETAQTPFVFEQLSVHIKSLEPANAQEAGAILDMIMDKIDLLSETTDKEDVMILEVELEVICTRMLVCMGIEPTPELAKNLILVLRKEYLLQQLEHEQYEEVDEGTHERKHDFRQLFYDLPDVVQPLTSALGRVTLLLVS